MRVLARCLPPIAALAMCAACTPPAEEEAAAPVGEPTTATGDDSSAEPSPEPGGDRLALAGTAWRVDGEDGGVYTTYLDPDGTYRDFRNGDPLQEGTWEEVSEGRLCFTPSEEGRSGECWANERQKKDGTMRTTSDSGLTVEVRQVTYVAASQDDE